MMKSLNDTINKSLMVKINNHRYHALKPNKNKYNQLKELLNQFTHKELTDFILNKVTYSSFILILHLSFFYIRFNIYIF